MAKPTGKRPLTPLGAALERCRSERGLNRTQAIAAAGSSWPQWSRWLHDEDREFEPGPIVRAAKALGLEVEEALRLIGYFVVPDGVSRVMTTSELLQLQEAG